MKCLYDATDKPRFFMRHSPHVRTFSARGELGTDANMIDASRSLEPISVYDAGNDSVDIEACKNRDIRFTNAPDVVTGNVADLATAMIVRLSRGVAGAENRVRNGFWTKAGHYRLSCRALGRRTGALERAPLDVFEDKTARDRRFLELHTVLLQPHHASGTVEAIRAMGQLMRNNPTAHFSGNALPSPIL